MHLIRAFTFDNLLIRLNEARLEAGLKRLTTDSFLSKEADDDLVDNCPVTGHERFRAKVDRGVFRAYRQVGEVLSGGARTPQQAIEGLLASPTHKDAILDPSFARVGIGLRAGSVNCVAFIIAR